MRYLSTEAESSARLFIARGFLGAQVCQQLSREIQGGTLRPATVYGPNGIMTVDSRHRRTCEGFVSKDLQTVVEARLDGAKADLQQHFGIPLQTFEKIQFLRYQRGDFFRLHQDSADHPRFGFDARCRKVSVVLFLNRQTRLPENQTYCGGELLLFQVDADPDPRLCVSGDTGLLVAFASDVLHEVRPVTYGERFTIVTWYLDRTL